MTALAFGGGNHDRRSGSPEGSDERTDDLGWDGGMVHEAEQDRFEAHARAAVKRFKSSLKG